MSSTVTVSSSISVDTPPDRVFAYLSDPVNQVEWTPNFLELEEGPDRAPGIGMRYRGRLKAFGAVNFVVDEFEPGRVFRVNTDPSVGCLTHRFCVTARGDGSTVSHEVRLEPVGVFRFTGPVMRVLIRRMVRDLDRQMTQVLNSLDKRVAMSVELPLPIADYVQASNARDAHTLLPLFTADAVVTDEGQEYRGVDGVKEWWATVESKYTFTIQPREVVERGAETVMTATLTGDFPGSPVDLSFDFTLHDEGISSLSIHP